jgi:uncharacterized membrane protein YraQ (UPF0718 family)
MNTNRRLTILIVFILLVMAGFWGSSRYPALSNKAALSGTAGFEDTMTHEAAFHIPDDATLPTQVLYTTLNWYETNWRGMAFGLVLAAAFLTLLSYLPNKPSDKRFRNSFMGMLVGTPLGVCVNCVAPIAKGIYEAGSKMETALAVMFSSPTLNIVVLTMLFTIFPFYMAMMKLVATFVLILIIVPLISKDPLPASQRKSPAPALVDSCLWEPGGDDWLQALTGSFRDYRKNLSYIVIRTVPLMLLAGLLGALGSHLWSFDKLIGVKLNLISLAFIAFMGTFLPLPIAFDLMLAQALMMSGLAPGFVMVLLFTLGTFSIYSAMIVTRTFSMAMAVKLYVIVCIIGMGLGWAANHYSEYKHVKWLERYESFSFTDAAKLPQNSAKDAGLKPPFQTTVRSAAPFFSVDSIVVESVAHTARKQVGKKLFTKIPGPDLGISYSNVLTPANFFDPFFFGRGIASGDLNGDGWTDIAIATGDGFELYLNRDGQRFQRIDSSDHDLAGKEAITVALVDLDNDGQLDVFTTTFAEGNFITLDPLNAAGKIRTLSAPNNGALLTNAPGFGDINGDGFLDFINGNYFLGVMTRTPVDRALDQMVINRNLQFETIDLPGIPGQTQTSLISDINGDHIPDVMVGNDYRVADTFYLGNGAGDLKKIKNQDGVIPVTTQNTMSMDTADFNNDLRPDIYLSNIGFSRGIDVVSNIFGDAMKESGRAFCDSGESALSASECHDMVRLVTLLNPERQDISERCTTLNNKKSVDECMVLRMALHAIKRKDPTLCEKIAADYSKGRTLCESYFQPKWLEMNRDEEIPMRTLSNVLLQGSTAQLFEDVSKTTGTATAEWSWNAKFADLDNDEWQDLYVVNGVLITQEFASNNFFHNNGGKSFSSKAEAVGLANRDHSSSYSYIDFDNDGDLDIIGNLLYGPFQVYINNEMKKNSATFKLRDQRGNRFCIGCRVTIRYGEGGERHQMREVKASGGFHSFDAPQVHFGLNRHDEIKQVEIEWSTGEKTLLDHPFPANREYTISRKPR